MLDVGLWLSGSGMRNRKVKSLDMDSALGSGL